MEARRILVSYDLPAKNRYFATAADAAAFCEECRATNAPFSIWLGPDETDTAIVDKVNELLRPYTVTANPVEIITDATPRPLRERKARRAQRASGYCPHGVYVGGIGIDWMCGRCEDGITRRDDLDAAMRQSPRYRVAIDDAIVDRLGLLNIAHQAHELARILARHGKRAIVTREYRDQAGRLYRQTYTYTPN